MKQSKLLFVESKENMVESILLRELEACYKKDAEIRYKVSFSKTMNESAVESISKFMLKVLPDRVMQMIPDITATISKELSDHDIDGILDRLLQDKDTFQRIAQKLMNRLMGSHC